MAEGLLEMLGAPRTIETQATAFVLCDAVLVFLKKNTKG